MNPSGNEYPNPPRFPNPPGGPHSDSPSTPGSGSGSTGTPQQHYRPPGMMAAYRPGMPSQLSRQNAPEAVMYSQQATGLPGPGGSAMYQQQGFQQGGPVQPQPGPSVGYQQQGYGQPPQLSQQGYMVNQPGMQQPPSSAQQPSMQSSSSSLYPPSSHASSSTMGPGPHSAKPDKPSKLNPPPLSPEILENLQNLSVGGLCTVGKEIVHELNVRTYFICHTVKAFSEKKMTNVQDIEILVDYCTNLFEKLCEIRTLIETKYTPNTTPLDLLESIMEPSPPSPEVENPELREKLKEFNDGKKKISELTHDLRTLDWLASVSDPATLRQIDKMSCTKFDASS